ncbi:MAG: hypothetical protein KGN76_07130 [Acidobacteriota bacterium]|nr:hypothetical protein [Acidobacteriota bacterium]
MPEPTDVERDLRTLETELKRLESEYNMFFAGRLPRPPWETRARVEALVKRYDRAHVQSYADRFRFATLQARFQAFLDLWDRGLRAREEGRPGPFARRSPERPAAAEGPTGRTDRIVHVASFADPVREPDKLRELYDRLAEARREAGEPAVPFHRFADLIREEVTKLRQGGSPEVAFRIAVREGKVNLTARALRGVRSE